MVTVTQWQAQREIWPVKSAPAYVSDAPVLTLPARPTIEDARQALLQLRQAFRTFADRATKSDQFDVDGKQVATDVVDLSKAPALLTAAYRSVLWLAPGFVHRSPRSAALV
jgi:hypothetical protein